MLRVKHLQGSRAPGCPSYDMATRGHTQNSVGPYLQSDKEIVSRTFSLKRCDLSASSEALMHSTGARLQTFAKLADFGNGIKASKGLHHVPKSRENRNMSPNVGRQPLRASCVASRLSLEAAIESHPSSASCSRL